MGKLCFNDRLFAMDAHRSVGVVQRVDLDVDGRRFSGCYSPSIATAPPRAAFLLGQIVFFIYTQMFQL
jgi:arylsulfatase A-like enzyme